LSIGGGSDIKIFPRRNEVLGRPTYDAICRQPVEWKVIKVFKLTKMILWTGSLVLLATYRAIHVLGKTELMV
jgi:hypothetical protein